MPAHSSRRPSISSPMHWLSRKDSKVSPDCSGGLHGAVVVRTPEDALRDTNVRVGFEPSAHPQPAGSPPLPPLPIPADGEVEQVDGVSSKQSRKPHRPVPRPPSPVPRPPSPVPRPPRPVPRSPSPAPSSSSSPRPSLKSTSSTAVDDPPPIVPPVPSHIPLSAPVPPFSPILVSSSPGPDLDSSRIIVTLETCTATYKSTLATLCSRPSFLADYLTSLAKSRTSKGSSVYSSESTDLEAYRDHLASQGLLGSASCSASFHIFLDRPSPPYAHVLTFLRTPSISSEYPSTLPRGVQLTSLAYSTSSTLFNAKLEALLELRDETAYIGLDSLHKLCTDEIRQRLSHAQRHARGSSASVNTMMSPGLLPSLSGGGISSIQSHHASVYSLHTLIEQGEGDLTVCVDKTALERVSKCSENIDEDDKSLISPLGFPTSPPPTTPPIIFVPSLKSVSTTNLQIQSPPPRHIKNPSTASHPSTTAVTIPKPIMKQLPKPSSSSPSLLSCTPPPSANSSPGQTYTHPPYMNHKKAESTSVLPLRSPPLPPSQHDATVPTMPGSGGGLSRSHGSSSSVGNGSTSPPGWL